MGIALTLTGLAVVALLVWALLQQSNWYESNSANRSRQYARDAENEIADRCAVAPLPDQAECIKKAVNTARANQREEQVLSAQKISAWWALIVGAAAIFGMVLSAIGAFLVFVTFRATREANRITLVSTNRQLRAYVTPDTLCYHVERGQIEIVISNHGQTPASDVTVVTEYSVEEGTRLIQTQPFGIIDPKHPRYVGIPIPLIVDSVALATHIWVTIHYRTFELTQNPYCRTQQFKILSSTKIKNGEVGGTLVGEGSQETHD